MNNTLNKFSKSLCLSFILYSSFLQTSALAASMSFKEMANFVAMQQTSAITSHSLHSLGFIPDRTDINTTGNFSESGFNSHISAIIDEDSLDINYSGNLDGEFGEDIIISLESTGYLGEEDISTSGKMTWFYDSLNNSYSKFEYDESGEINPVWKPFIVGFLVREVLDYFLDDDEVNIEINGEVDNLIINPEIKGDLNINLDNGTCSGLGTNSCSFNSDGSSNSSSATVPEPLTILGALTAICFGSLFKKRLS